MFNKHELVFVTSHSALNRFWKLVIVLQLLRQHCPGVAERKYYRKTNHLYRNIGKRKVSFVNRFKNALLGFTK